MICASASAATTQEIRQAIEKGKTFLYSAQKNGNWELEEPPPAKQNTGQTAMVLYALLASGESPNEPRLAPAIEYLKKTATTGTYALGMRCQVWLLLPNKPDIRAAMLQDAKVLLSSIKQKGPAKGFYFYNPGPRDDEYDHSASQYGVLGAWAAAQMGVEIPPAYWKLVEEGWIAHQDASGGWAYTANRDLPNTPGMTSVGVATLAITQEYLHANDGIPCKGNIRSPSMEKGVKWLAENFAKVGTNERYPRDYPYATIYSVARAGLASGLKYYGDVNWYEKGAGWLVKSQRSNGQWPEEEGMPHFSTSMALLFLSRGSAPVMMNKLDYSASAEKEANWNQRPRDVANIARWTGRQIERELNWQILNLNVPVEELHDAPILYLAGNQAIHLSPEQEQKLKTFMEQGGIILGNPDCASPVFAKSFKDLGAKLFPKYEFSPLSDTHPIYTNQMFSRAKWKRKPTILALRNGAREMMILLPTADIGKAWQTQQPTGKEELFQIAANIFLYAVDKQDMRARGDSHIVQADPKVQASKPIKVARLSYQGNFDPEPGGWRRLAAVMHNASQGELAAETINPESAKLDGFQVAHLTGTVEFALTPAAREEVKRFVGAGGTLVVDSAGGSSAFAKAVETELGAMFGGDAKQLDEPLPPSHALYSADGKPLGEIGYRRFARAKLGSIKVPQLRGITQSGRVAVVYSKEDLSVGLVGQPVDGIIGYDPPTATTLMSKVLMYAAGKKAPPATARSK